MMTKSEYLNRLKNALNPLSQEEQKLAYEYYEEYFEDAGFDEAVVFKTLGTPEVLAQSIIKDAAQPVKKCSQEKPNDDYNFLSFSGIDIKSLSSSVELEIGRAHV